jgi:Homeodomain-like domain
MRTLGHWSRSSGIWAALAERAKILLLAAEGVSNARIARQVGCSKPRSIPSDRAATSSTNRTCAVQAHRAMHQQGMRLLEPGGTVRALDRLLGPRVVVMGELGDDAAQTTPQVLGEQGARGALVVRVGRRRPAQRSVQLAPVQVER